ncbi:16S rRNA (cytosine(1402)-N(4))-methyltransferase RsmH [Frankia nepalensis]|uniref:Ribosomal RNA small subunit methyltransferase H n=1 Tax=Frankia nepalensis TaxID=1836974 RepID=A0A937RXP4_9ACTN|nr:16S rRNA (cytosine(1402)-N(4))-methyltransferase RsmH [Frankia nepalensis]MBL7501612.1 16S rRNA (cytosine(1402)-N(4))-methyltransferase RsmH [Frankia nepalensis]MBL7513381.1 16S rRNA (cytosine(1402)-N(4))-methyltransferase RsmH [Frankia nepalensis]MBL7633701.1 16S rRNA (cytosine(1402)-N(4))-methyltransferase RsmH [Frankia nepalensis]
MQASHIPVLLDRVRALLTPALRAPGAIAVDTTLGLGGHAEALLRELPELRLVGLDRDPQALAASRRRLAFAADRVEFAHAVYDELPAVLDRLGIRTVQAVLFDLGVSSLQLDTDDRGFAYSRDAPLDMRMDPTSGRTAADVLNTYDEAALARVLRRHGEEPFARRIAAAVVAERAREPFQTSARLADLVRAAIPAAARRTGGNPAKRTFQALRIEVNGELDALESALPAALAATAVGGRVVVLAYHSLEDRMVKRAFTEVTTTRVPPDMPVVPAGAEPAFRSLVRGSEQAADDEVAANPRATSARLRAVERVRPSAAAAAGPTARTGRVRGGTA